jgi:ribonuclease HIII
MGKKLSEQNIVKKTDNKKPRIIIKDISISEKTYNVTQIKLKNKEKLYVIWHNEKDFRYGFAKLKRHESTRFLNSDIIDIKTKTHKYVSTRFVAKGFKP